ncbi:serine-rich adhesin for platelets-like [Cheilinus undulatus]|uniref:serine-rich adhesin for platelets-like n=1 Tax=Cheilinus undulatus TaxID=241271 RepID=UPI001BD5C5DD|nr:serine-rich adhesin for platelets-like [Cheilinus undulatus]
MRWPSWETVEESIAIHEVRSFNLPSYVNRCLIRAMMSKRKARIKPVEDAISYILSARDKPWFAERFINNIKGRGVFATEPIEQGSFVLEYRGEFISAEECQSRNYSETQSAFLYEFDWKKSQCIDASKEDGSLGRLVNDNHKYPNCIMNKVISSLSSCFMSKHQVTSKQAPAPEEEMAALPVNLSSCVYDDDKNAAAADGPKVTSKQAPAPEEEMAALPVNLSSCVYDDDENAAAAADGPKMHKLEDFGQPLSDSDESIVEDTDYEDSIKDYSDVQSDIEVVPKLRRAKSIQMRKVSKYSDALYNSSDDITEDTSTWSKSEMASQRPKRGCVHPMQKILVGSDASSADSGEEYIPGPMEESTDSDCSLEIPMANKNMKKVSTIPKRCKSSSKDRFKSSSQSQFKSSSQSQFESSSQSQFKSSSQSQFESSSQSQFESSSQSQFKSSSQSQFKSSSQSQFESSSQSQFESSSQSQFKSSSQSQFESSSQSQFESSSQRGFESSSQSSSFETNNGPAESTCMNEEKVGQTCTDEHELENHENNASVYVNPVLKKEDGSRRYNKKHHCFYCKKVVQKMSRHLLRSHNDEIDVSKAFSSKKTKKKDDCT